MAENNKIENTKQIEGDELNKVTGGTTVDDLKDDLFKFFDGFEVIINATKTNTCPICSQKIVPNAENCDLKDFTEHYSAVHYNK